MTGVSHDPSFPALEVTDLRVILGGTIALEAVSFALRKGDSVAVVGPNGAGKSTLFRAISGIIERQAGRITVYGSATDSHTCIAYVPQASIVDWSFPVTVFDVVMMGRTRRIGMFRRPRRADRSHVYQCLEMVNMEELAQRQIGELSGGQKQRVFIARALAQEAEIVLMDEPFTGLDVGSQRGIFVILRGLTERGVTLLVSTHDLDVAAEHFARIMLLNRTLVAFGAPGEVMQPELLLPTFGSHASVQAGDPGKVLIYDTCCDGGEPVEDDNKQGARADR
ncbi:MAG: metal ABC transporter ATP-binding protein [Spirochaetia bacterium]|jgi:manganese/iron transport system ATP-binding protein